MALFKEGRAWQSCWICVGEQPAGAIATILYTVSKQYPDLLAELPAHPCTKALSMGFLPVPTGGCRSPKARISVRCVAVHIFCCTKRLTTSSHALSFSQVNSMRTFTCSLCSATIAPAPSTEYRFCTNVAAQE